MPQKFNFGFIEWLWPIVAATGWGLAFIAYYTGGFTTRITEMEGRQTALEERIDKMAEVASNVALDLRSQIQSLRNERQVITQRVESEIAANKALLDAEVSANKVRSDTLDRFENQTSRNFELIVQRTRQIQDRLDAITTEMHRRGPPDPPPDPPKAKRPPGGR